LKQEPISQIATQEQVSRKFLDQQKTIAQIALNTAFEKPEKDNEVLYYLPVTQKWIVQLILGLILICHCSYRGVIELLRDFFDYSVSIGTIHNRVQEAVGKAREINQSQDLMTSKFCSSGSEPRTSSLVENLNSRLRNYFFLRKHLNSDYLELLRFFLNHRTFMTSRKPERKGKSPKELMTGEKHPHWLEMLGFERFQRA